MNPRTKATLLATLVASVGWSQEISVQGTTMAQMWKQDTPGFDKATYTPVTQYLGIDATKLGSDQLSLHLFGWGRTDMGTLSDASTFDGSKSGGYLNYGYLQYRFEQANAEIKAGRFTVNQSTGFEQVDGVSVRTDLRGGFNFSAFGGRPVLFKVVDPRTHSDYELQHDFIFGTRIGWRLPQMGELGVSYLQDGTKPAQDQTPGATTDFTRKQLGADLLIAPVASFDLRGRTILDVAKHPDQAPGAPERSKIASHDYTATWRMGEQLSVSGNFAERNFFAYFAGTNLPSLFRQNDNDMFKGWGGSITWTPPSSFQLVADYRHMHRETFGDVNRAGGEMRWSFNEKAVLLGVGAHWANALDTKFVDPSAPSRSLSHKEARIWTMVTKDKVTLSLDGILQRYDLGNPYLLGLRNVWETVASLGYQATANFKVSGDVSYGSTPLAKQETRALLRADYRFGFAQKGGK